jgi:hypothetical protein
MYQLVLLTALTTAGLFDEASQTPSAPSAPTSSVGAPVPAIPAADPNMAAPAQQPQAPVSSPVPVGVGSPFVPAMVAVDGALVPAVWVPATPVGTPVPLPPPGAMIPTSVRMISPAPADVRTAYYSAPMTVAQPLRVRGRRIRWTRPLRPTTYVAPVGVMPTVGYGPSVPTP